MNDSNIHPARSSSLADLVQKPLSLPHHPQKTDSDGSQQERNHQVSPVALARASAEVSKTGRIQTEASSKSPYRKQRLRQGAFSSLTNKDLTSSAQVAIVRELQVRNVRCVEGSTEVIGKEKEGEKETRTMLLEENRSLRIELEEVRYRLRKVQNACRKQRKNGARKDKLLQKYRTQLVGLFEADSDMFGRKLGRDCVLSHVNSQKQKRADGVSDSNSQDEEWSSYSFQSASVEHEQWEEGRGSADYVGAKAIERKKGRTRAPAWTQEEEVIFMQAYAKHGCRWKLFQDSLPGRSRRQIQSHGSYLIRQGKLLKKNSRPWQRRKPGVGSMKEATTEGEMKDHSEED